MKENIWKQLYEKIEEQYIYREEPMSKHTTFRIGGNAECFIDVNSKEALQHALQVCRANDIPYYVIGNGSNVLVSDAGLRGVVICIGKFMSRIHSTENSIYVEAGAILSRVAKEALKQELTGLEFAAGIPGTIGGAVAMNAGAYGGEMKDVIVNATIIDREGTFRVLTNAELDFRYRGSRVQLEEFIVVDVTLELKKGSTMEISEKMKELKLARVSKQPLEFPSAGSTFKRPEGYFAAKLIDDAGLRGLRVGDAQISEKHCGFLINRGNATAKDVRLLMKDVEEKVHKVHGVKLEAEVKCFGEF